MTDRHSVAEARRNLPSLVRAAESGAAVELTRHGKSVAVLISWKAFEQLAAGRRRFTEAYAAFAKDADLQTLGLNPDEVFGTVRDMTSICAEPVKCRRLSMDRSRRSRMSTV